MKFTFKNAQVEIQSPALMGSIVVLENDPRSLKDYAALASRMEEEGADFIEVGFQGHLSEEVELQTLPEIVGAVFEATQVHIAIATSYPKVIEECFKRGAVMVISTDALRHKDALSTIAKLNAYVCLTYDGKIETEDGTDPTAAVSEFIYERIDACLNAGISRSKLILDPSPAVTNSFETRLKAIGRLHTLKSFALPLSIATPKCIPDADDGISEHCGVYIAVALFAIDAGVGIIRTEHVGEVNLAIETHLACTKSARPFKLSRAIVKALKKRRESKARS